MYGWQFNSLLINFTIAAYWWSYCVCSCLFEKVQLLSHIHLSVLPSVQIWSEVFVVRQQILICRITLIIMLLGFTITKSKQFAVWILFMLIISLCKLKVIQEIKVFWFHLFSWTALKNKEKQDTTGYTSNDHEDWVLRRGFLKDWCCIYYGYSYIYYLRRWRRLWSGCRCGICSVGNDYWSGWQL